MKYKKGDLVFLWEGGLPVTVMYEYSGHYDFQYTGSDSEGVLFYFNDEDVCETI
jgi:hypothetical protein